MQAEEARRQEVLARVGDYPQAVLTADGWRETEGGVLAYLPAFHEYRYGDLLQVDDVTPMTRRAAAPKVEPEAPGDKEYTIEGFLKKAEPSLAELFLALRDRILSLPGVWEKVGPSYGDYRTTSTFVSPNVQPRKKRLLVYIKMGERIPDDPRGWTERGDFFGKLNTRFYLQPGADLDYTMDLIRQAYEYVGL